MDNQNTVQVVTWKEFMKEHYGSQQEFARQMGVSHQTIVNWVSGDRINMLRILPQLVGKFGEDSLVMFYNAILKAK